MPCPTRNGKRVTSGRSARNAGALEAGLMRDAGSGAANAVVTRSIPLSATTIPLLAKKWNAKKITISRQSLKEVYSITLTTISPTSNLVMNEQRRAVKLYPTVLLQVAIL